MSDADELGLVKVSNRLEVPLMNIAEGLNELARVNGVRLATVSEALAVFPVPPFVEVTETESLKTPVVVAVTVTATTQVWFGRTVPPVNTMEFDPFAAVAVPPQSEFNPPGVATISPAGSVLVNASPFRIAPPGLFK